MFTHPQVSNGLPAVKFYMMTMWPPGKTCLAIHCHTHQQHKGQLPPMANSKTPAVATFMQTLANNLRWHMTQRGMTKHELAERSGVAARTITNFLYPENRKTKKGTVRAEPSGTLAILYNLAAAFDIEPWELLCDVTSERIRFHDAVELAFQERIRAEHLNTPSRRPGKD